MPSHAKSATASRPPRTVQAGPAMRAARQGLQRKGHAGAALAAPGGETARTAQSIDLPALLALANRGPTVALPTGLRQRVEHTTGGHLGGVRVHTGPASQQAARALNAKAYTLGQDLHFGVDQYRPGEPVGDRLIAHELVHTLQQGPGSGAVQAKLDLSRPGDDCEREADRIAAAVIDGQPGGGPATAMPVQAARKALTRVDVKNGGATFKLDPYALLDPDNGSDTTRDVGIDIDITYASADSLRSDKIAFVQTMKVAMDGKPFLFSNETPRATKSEPGCFDWLPFVKPRHNPAEEGWAVDRLKGRESPNYGQDNGGTAGGNTRFGYRKSSTDAADAWMHDRLNLTRSAGETFSVDAVTFALDETHGAYLGGVSWGMRTDKAGKSTLQTAALANTGNPGGVQKKALEMWNKQADLADVSQRNAPDQKKVVVP